MPVPARRRGDSDDPLDEVLRPPPDETPEQKAVRLEREAEAKRISQAIDASIKAERQEMRKKRIVRLLLLGQSESGKSTTLRQFQRLYTPTAFREERILWRAVIQLNIVRSIRIILEALESPISPTNSPYSSPRSRARSISRGPPPPPLPSTSKTPPPLPHASPSYAYDSQQYPGYNSNGEGSGRQSPGDAAYLGDADQMQFGSPPRGAGGGGHHRAAHHHGGSPQPRHRNQHASGSRQPYPHHRAPSNPESEVDDSDYGYDSGGGSGAPAHGSRRRHGHGQGYGHGHNQQNQQGMMYGSPRSLHNSSSTLMLNAHLDALKHKLAPLKRIEAMLIAKLVPENEEEATHFGLVDHMSASNNSSSGQGSEGVRGGEVFIRPGMRWKGALSRARVQYDSTNGNRRPRTANGQEAEKEKDREEDEPQAVLNALRRDVEALWGDAVVREILRRKKVRLEEESGFFLDELERVTSLKYMPSDDDVLKARLKTVGVSEYKFEMEVSAGKDSGTEWRIVDVGGSRSQRPTWIPFFDDVDAIIFLAPISAFDQVLTEDRSVNRLEDSVLLWKAVCSNKLLANVDLVLFLNKCDILERKLNDGVRLAKYVRTYGDRENTLDGVSKYLRGKFAAIHREYSPNPRKFYVFCTSVTDAATTAGIIASVRDMVIRQHLKQSKLL